MGQARYFPFKPTARVLPLLHVFSAALATNPTNQDGAKPNLQVLAGDTLYGVTPIGGTNGSGSVFKMKTDGSGFTTLHTFSLLVPSYPGSSLGLNKTAPARCRWYWPATH